MSQYSFLYYLKPWILPPGINILLILVGSVLQVYLKILGRILILLGFLSLWAFSTPFVAYKLINNLQNKFPILEKKFLSKNEKNTAILILGGGDKIEPEYNYQLSLSDFTTNRLRYAIYLKKQTKLPLILTGGTLKNSTQSIASLMNNKLKEHHIKAEFIEDKSLNTAENAKYTISMLKNHKYNKIFLVTDAWHIPRAMYIFNCSGIKLIPAPMGHLFFKDQKSIINFFPNIKALKTSTIAIHEFLGLCWYHFFYKNTCNIQASANKQTL